MCRWRVRAQKSVRAAAHKNTRHTRARQEGLFEMDLRRVNSEEIGHAMNDVLAEANERIKFPLHKLVVALTRPRVRVVCLLCCVLCAVLRVPCVRCACWAARTLRAHTALLPPPTQHTTPPPPPLQKKQWAWHVRRCQRVLAGLYERWFQHRFKDDKGQTAYDAWQRPLLEMERLDVDL